MASSFPSSLISAPRDSPVSQLEPLSLSFSLSVAHTLLALPRFLFSACDQSRREPTWVQHCRRRGIEVDTQQTEPVQLSGEILFPGEGIH